MSLRCPYCRADLDGGLVTACQGCNTIYHRGCADEAGACGTLGCDQRIRQREELPLTGVTIEPFDAGKLFVRLLVILLLPAAGALVWAFADAGYAKEAYTAAGCAVALLVVGTFLPLAVGGRRGRWRYLGDPGRK